MSERRVFDRRRVGFMGALFLLSALACTREFSSPPTTSPYITGTITAVDRAGERIGSIRVEEAPADSVGSAKAVLRIDQDTRMFETNGRAAGFNHLQVGRRVRVWVTGPVAESYPVQAKASAIEIGAP